MEKLLFHLLDFFIVVVIIIIVIIIGITNRQIISKKYVIWVTHYLSLSLLF